MYQGKKDIVCVNIYWKQLNSLLKHKWYVFLAGRFVGVPLWWLIVHDWSKFMPSEFFVYSRWKYGDATNKDWSTGWLHHLHCSPHHPEHWILSWHGEPSFYEGIGESIAKYVSILPMPEIYVHEMVADMMATSKEVSGSYDIAMWLNENGSKMRLHSETITRLDNVMHDVGYLLTDNCPWSYMAGSKFRKWNGELRKV